MAEYIEKQALLNEMHSLHSTPLIMGHITDEDIMFKTMVSLVEEQPTADVVEVKHGYWIENDYRSFDGFETVVYPNEALKCSECSHNFKKELLWRKNYCPECGAKMDGERKCDNG